MPGIDYTNFDVDGPEYGVNPQPAPSSPLDVIGAAAMQQTNWAWRYLENQRALRGEPSYYQGPNNQTAPVAPEERIAPEQAKKLFPGVTGIDQPLPMTVLKNMEKDQVDQGLRDDVMSRWKGGPIAATALGFVGGVLDPVADAAFMVPALGEVREAALIARAGEAAGILGRAGAKLGVGAFEGGAGGTILAGAHLAAGDPDQTLGSSVTEVLQQAAYGALFHSAFGYRDITRGPKHFGPEGFLNGRFAASPEGAAAASNSFLHDEATRVAAAQMANGDPIEVRPVFDQGYAARSEPFGPTPESVIGTESTAIGRVPAYTTEALARASGRPDEGQVERADLTQKAKANPPDKVLASQVTEAENDIADLQAAGHLTPEEEALVESVRPKPKAEGERPAPKEEPAAEIAPAAPPERAPEPVAIEPAVMPPEATEGAPGRPGGPPAPAFVPAEVQQLPRPRDYGASNTIVTQERAAELKARILARRNQAGGYIAGQGGALDPEQFRDLTEYGAYHIEAGARAFGAWASQMIEDFGEWARPFLRPVYDMVRSSYPDMAGGMTAHEKLTDHMIQAVGDRSAEGRANFVQTLRESGRAIGPDGRLFRITHHQGETWNLEQETEDGARSLVRGANVPLSRQEAIGRAFTEAFGKEPEEAQGTHAERVADFFLRGGQFNTIAEARKFLADLIGEPIQPGTEAAKRADEIIEEGVVIAARQLAHEAGVSPEDNYDRMVDLYGRQPSLTVRSSTSIERQAYSTPAPLAYLAGRRARITETTTVYEPTAGNGMLLIDARPEKVTANEIDPDRAATLRRQGFASVTEHNAAEHRPLGAQDVVIANPPFGVVRDAEGEPITYHLGGGYETREVDHAIAIKALESMKPDGHATLILGSVNKLATGEGRAAAYNGKAKREFYYRLYNSYNVTDHFTVSGDLYARQGAAWPVDVIVIDGQGKSALPLPAVSAPRIYETWDALKEALNDRRTEVSEQPEEAVGQPPGGVGGGQAGALEEPPGGGRGAGRPSAAATPGERPSATHGEHPGGEPGGPRPQLQPSADEQGAPGEHEPGTGGGLPELESLGDEQAPTQVPYKPRSQAGAPLDTLSPVNMASATQDALAAVSERHGADIDHYVGDRLGIEKAKLGDMFSPEQVDALALALDNMERGAGFIIGDQTGIGKGRVVAGVLRYAMKKGKIPIFITEKPNLYGDMYRDMRDVGIEKMLGRKPRILMTNANERVPLDDGRELVTGQAKAHTQNLVAVAKGQGERPDVIFTTYNQMQTVKGEATARMEFLRRMGRDSIVVFDESHNAGGQGEKRKPKGAPPDRAEFAREIADQADGVLFSSATYAKRPDVMDLYKPTDIKLAVADIKKLPDLVAAGGVPLQQAVAQMLAKAGQYIRRERSFAGVDYETPHVPVDHGAYAGITEGLSQIVSFEKEHLEEVIKNLSKAIRANAQAITGDTSTGGAGVVSTNFTSIMHNLIDQMLLGMKADHAADLAIQALKEGRKPVVTVANTLESVLNDYTEQRGIAHGGAVKADFRDLLQRYLDRTRRITIKEPFSKEKGTPHYLTDEEIGPAAVAAFARVRDFINSLEIPSVPFSPIDHIRNRIEQAGYKTSEITGRTNYLDYSGKTPILRARTGKERGISGRAEAINGFNNGGVDALVINQAGSTGLSLHASERYKDQSRREMILAQPERNIDTHMQMLGRVHRTGQVVPPIYRQLVADVPAETRPAAVLQKKMASLNANTTGARGSALTVSEAPDFMNHIGDQVVAQMVLDDPMLNIALGDPVSIDDSGRPVTEDAARKVTGRLMLLPPEAQARFYDQMFANYRRALAEAEANGLSPLEAKTLPLDAKLLESRRIVAGRPGAEHSPFGGPVNLETHDVKRIGRPLPFAEVIHRLGRVVGAEPDEHADAASLQGLARAGADKARREVQKTLDEFYVFRRTQPHAGKVVDDLTQNITDFQQRAGRLHPGMMVTTSQGGEEAPGIVLSVYRDGRTKNPIALSDWGVRIAVADSRQMIDVPLSRARVSEASEGNTVSINPYRGSAENLEEAFRSGALAAREKRQFATGNLLAAFEHIKGAKPIVNFVTHAGEVRAGIQLPRSFDYEKMLGSAPYPFSRIEDALQWLRSGRGVTAGEASMAPSRPTLRDLIIRAPASKKEGGHIFLDPRLRQAIGGDFYKRGGGMEARVPLSYEGDERPLAVLRELHRIERLTAVEHSKEARDTFEPKTGPQFQRPAEPAAAPAEGEPVGKYLRGQAAEDTARNRQLAEEINGLIGRLAPGAEARPFETLAEGATGETVFGATFSQRGPEGWRHIIAYALASPDVQHTAAHEITHALDRMNLYTRDERMALDRAAMERGWLDKYQIRARYPELSLDGQIEEAIGEAFADWRRTNAVPEGPGYVADEAGTAQVGGFFQRLKAAFDGIAKIVRGLFGQHVTAEDVFQRIESGEIGARQPTAGLLPERTAFQRPGALTQEEIEERAETQRRVTIYRDIAKQHALASRIADVRGQGLSLAHGFDSLVRGISEAVPGARASTAAHQVSQQKWFVSSLSDALNRIDGGWAAWAHRTETTDWVRELHELNKHDGGQPGITKNPLALKIAHAVQDAQDSARYALNRSGAWIGDYDGYVAKTLWDAIKVHKAGYAQWRDDVLNGIDRERTFEGLETNEQVEDFLHDTWLALSTGVHFSSMHGIDPKAGAYGPGPGNIARRISQSRVLHWRDADAWRTNQEKYGDADIERGVLTSLHRAGRDAALMEDWGSAPQRAFEQLLQKTYATYRDIDDGNAVIQLKRSERRLREEFAYLTGEAQRPGNDLKWKIRGTLLSIQDITKLGNVLLAHMSVFATKPFQLQYQGIGRWQAYTSVLRNLFQDKSPEGRQIMENLRANATGQFQDLMSGYEPVDGVPGQVAALRQLAMRLGGLPWMIARQKSGSEWEMANFLGQNIGKTFDRLNVKTQRGLTIYGIGPAEWDALRSIDLHERDAAGSTYLTPAAAQQADVDPFIQDKLRRAVDVEHAQRIRADARDRLGMKLASYYSDVADRSTITPGIAERAMFSRAAGRFGGPLVGQYKIWAMSAVRQMWGQAIYGSSKAEAVKSLAELVAVGTAIGYARVAISAFLRGENPPLFNGDTKHDAALMSEAALSGGGLGIFGDYLLGQFTRSYGHDTANWFMSQLAGPAVGDITSLAGIGHDIAVARFADDPDEAMHRSEGEMMRFLTNHLPIVNVWYLSLLSHWLVTDRLNEMADPGYLQRHRDSVRERTGREMWLPPPGTS